MGFRQGLNDWLSIVWKGLGLLFLAAFIIYIGLSVWGNIATSNMQNNAEGPKATYEFLVATTGEKIYANEYEKPADGQYLLNGYYVLERNRWRWHSDVLLLDEEYTGPILMKRK